MDHCAPGTRARLRRGLERVRELAFVEDSNGYAWATSIRRRLLETCRTVSESEAKCLDVQGYATPRRRYRNLLTRGGEMPPIPERTDGKRAKAAKFDAHNLCEQLRKHKTAVLCQ